MNEPVLTSQTENVNPRKLRPGNAAARSSQPSSRVWSSAGDGVHVFDAKGQLIAKILVPQTPANLCFGGDDGKMLFITAQKSLYSIKTNVTGTSNMKK